MQKWKLMKWFEHSNEFDTFLFKTLKEAIKEIDVFERFYERYEIPYQRVGKRELKVYDNDGYRIIFTIIKTDI